MILNVVLIDGEKLTFNLDKDTCVIGRSGQCDAVIPHESVSRKHCQIDYREGELFVTDLGSINGVMLDGAKITPNTPTRFQSFFTLSFGAVQSLTVELAEEHTSIQMNPLLATTLQVKDPRPSASPQKKTIRSPAENAKKAEPPKDNSMNNFIVLCVFVVLGFAFFIFKDNILSLLE